MSPFTEQRLVRAYTLLFLVPPGEDGSKSVSLARFGNYEVRIIELAHDGPTLRPRFWMELYAHDIACALDSCACDDLEQGTVAGERLVAQAMRMNEECGGAAHGTCH